MNLLAIKSVVRVIGSPWTVCLAAALAALLPGCRRAPTSPLVSSLRSIHKLEGTPAHVYAIQFAPDGASVLVLERRAPKDESGGERATFAISRRPVAGGAAKDLL